MRRRMLAGLILLTIAVGVGYRGMETGDAARDSSASSKLNTSPCGALRLPTWSPDGKRIAAVGFQWPRPRYRTPGHILRAICIVDADGRHAEPLPATVSNTPSDDLIDSPLQLVWARPALLVYGDNFRFFRVPVGAKEPKQIGGGDSFSVSGAGNRLAVGVGVSQFVTPGPVNVLRLPSGAIVGRVGGNRLNNTQPSLSPNGMQVVFVRNYADESGRTLGIWTAWADGSHLRRLAQTGSSPLWSPAGGKIAYWSRGGLRVVSLHGGATKLLVPQPMNDIFGWSPNGKLIAYSDRTGRLAVVQIATGKVRKLLKVGWTPSVAWSPNSRQLLVSTNVKADRCYAIWRVPARGGKPKLLLRC